MRCEMAFIVNFAADIALDDLTHGAFFLPLLQRLSPNRMHVGADSFGSLRCGLLVVKTILTIAMLMAN